ncbi:hypothetical protein O3G_MSEX010976 [Manduca sexta]|nr:hypothetical protein O3G_MSEX010976 [Manduca sexta]
MEIVKKLMVHMERAEGTLYRDELLTRMVEICAQNNYQHVLDFEWYVTVLADLTEMETSAKHGVILAAQLTEVGARVAEVRAFAARECAALCSRAAAAAPGPASREVLYAAAYVLAEYCQEEEVMRESVSPLLVCAGVGGPQMRARAVCVHAAFKLTAKLLVVYEQRGDMEAAVSVVQSCMEGMRPLLCSEDMEVQERAHNATALLAVLLRRLRPDLAPDLAPHLAPQHAPQHEPVLLVEHEQSNGFEVENESGNDGENRESSFSGGLIEELADLFDGELKPVAPKAQKKVPMPADLNLEQWLSRERWSSDSSSSEEEGEPAALFSPPQRDARPTAQFTPEELQMLREARRLEQANNPHYLKDDSPRSYQQDDIPVAEIALEVPLQLHAKRSDKYLKTRESSSKKKKEKRTSKKRRSKKEKVVSESDSEESWCGSAEAEGSRPAVAAGGELPEGAALSDDEPPRHARADDPHAALDLDLDRPLREDELLTSRIQQYPSPNAVLLDEKPKPTKKTKINAKDSAEKVIKKKKDKKTKRRKDADLMLPEVAKNDVTDDLILTDNDNTNGKKSSKENIPADEEFLVVPKDSKTEKHTKSKKDSKAKDSKKKKSKKDKHETKIGYEEALAGHVHLRPPPPPPPPPY